MSKELIEEKAMLYALGTLPDEEVEAFEELIRQDGSVQTIVHEFQAVTELDLREGAQAEPSFGVYSRIMARIDGERAESSADKAIAFKADARPARRRGKLTPFFAWSGWGLAACAGVALVISLTNVHHAPPRSDIVLNNLSNPRVVAVKTPSDETSLEDRMLELSGLAEAYWFSREGVPSDQLLSNSDTDVEPLSGGFTIFDRKYQIGYIAVDNLPKKQEGKSYHVWAKTNDGSKTVRAGALPIGDESRGLFFFDLSGLPHISSLDQVSFFVTEENTEDPVKPGPMVVLSDF